MVSTRNASGGPIQVGSPVALAVTGLIPADFANPAVGIALSGGPPGSPIGWESSGTISRSDWSLVAGTRSLAAGQTYYVTGSGQIAPAGTQQVGVATSSNELAISIHQSLPQLAQIHPVTTAPPATLGRAGDLAYDGLKGNLWGPKTPAGWPRLPNKLITVAYDPNLSPVQAAPSATGWQVCS